MSGLPAGWLLVPLSEVADVRWGDTSKTKASYVSEGFTAFSASGADGYLKTFDFEGAGIVLSAIGAACGKVFWADGKWSAIKNTICILPDESRVDPKYLYLALADPNSWAKRGAAQPFIRQVDARARELPLPPLEVQQRIVETLEGHLSRLDKALAEVEEGRRRSDSLVRSIRRDVFSPEEIPSGWVMTNVGNVLVPMNGKRLTQRGWSPQCLNHVRQSDDQWAVLKTTAIQLGDFQPQHHKELPSSLEAKPEIEIKQGDLIITATGPRNRCGVPCLVSTPPPRLMMSGKMFRVRTDDTVCDPRWLLEFLLSDAGQTQLENLKVGSSDSSVSIGADQFERIQMPMPPVEVQREILGAMDEKIGRARDFALAVASTSLQTETLRRSLLHVAFTGHLTNEEPND